MTFFILRSNKKVLFDTYKLLITVDLILTKIKPWFTKVKIVQNRRVFNELAQFLHCILIYGRMHLHTVANAGCTKDEAGHGAEISRPRADVQEGQARFQL